MLKKLLMVLVLFGVTGCAHAVRSSGDDYEAAITGELDAMLRAWNADDLEAHLSAYSDTASWMTANGVIKGKNVIRESLERSFLRGNDLLGELAFSDTQLRKIAPDVVMSTGAFHLRGLPSGNPVDGRSTLIWVHVDGRWRIMHDHSS